jgi:Putative adhesin
MISRRLSIVWPLLIVVAAVVWLMQAVGTLPAAIADLIGRGWPIILVLVGLMLLLGRRVRFGNVISIVVCALLVGGVVTAAYSQQSGKVRTENHKTLEQAIDPGMTNLKIDLTTLITDIEIIPDAASSITADFTGSKESTITNDYQVEGKSGTFTLVETQTSAIPSLEALGKGKLTLHVPNSLTLDQVKVTGREGEMIFDASTVTLKNLTLATGSGNVTIKLPDKSGLIGDIKTGSGSVVVQVPKTIAANLTLRGAGSGNVEYNPADYVLDVNRVLISKRAPEPQMQITVDAGGKITVQ